MKCKLANICDFAKQKIDVASLDISNYISTENMMPNKAGIADAATLPNVVQTQSFEKGDTLVSNIRPYFKKIWYASFEGGCSNDVLVFRAKTNVNPRFLYYVLANDTFFEYATSTAKGTKMPRGDKKAILEYEVPDISYKEQKKIANVLSALDDTIALNQQINKNLEEQTQALYKSWFVDFEPFGGEMPTNWTYRTLEDIATVSSGKRPPMKSDVKTKETHIPIVGASSVMGFTNEANHSDKILVIGRVGTHGIVQRFNRPCWTSDNTLVLTSQHYEYVYQILRTIDYASLNRGSTQPLITQSDIKKLEILLPTESIARSFEGIVEDLMLLHEENISENEKLSNLRDALLPRLMSGEIDVSGIEI